MEVITHTFGYEEAPKRQAIASFRQAVTLDSSFALAWARLGLVESRLYASTGVSTDAAQSRTDIDRALALNPELPQAHHALGAYYGNVFRDDRRAVIEDSIAVAHAPRDVEAIGSLAQAYLALSRPLDAIRVLETAKHVDPRSVSVADRMSGALVAAGRWREATAEAERGLVLDPTSSGLLLNNGLARTFLGDDAGALAQWNRMSALDPTGGIGVLGRVMLLAREGDLAGARALLNAPPPGTNLVALDNGVGLNGAWVLDGAAADRFLRTPFATFGEYNGAPSDVALARAGVYRLRGDSARMRVEADSGRRYASAALDKGESPVSEANNLSVADALLGHQADALREIAAAAGMVQPGSVVDAFTAKYTEAYIRIILGDRDGAANALVTAMHMPGCATTIAALRVDPTWAPLHGVPAFQRLVAEGRPIA
jgi:tetratricopeptide (TPR) repeat protein